MNAEQAEKVRRLAAVTMLPGTSEKRFVRSLGAYKPDTPLSEKQSAWLDKLFYKYRRQLARFGPMPRYVTVGELEAMGELTIEQKVELGDVTVCRWRSKLPHVHGKYYAQRAGLYLWHGGTWHSTTWTKDNEADPPGYFDDLPTLLDHLFVATHRPADSPPEVTEG